MIEYLVLGGAVAGAVGWERLRRRRYERQYQAFLATLSDETQVVLHVANHNATQRRQPLAPVHIAYGLLQDETFVAAIRTLGGDPDALEAQVLELMDREAIDVVDTAVPEAVMVIAHAAAIAQRHERKATLADVFGRFVLTRGGALFAAPPLTAHALLFLLVHQEITPRTQIAGARDVLVVLRDDDCTTMEFVVDILREEFGLADAEAQRVMRETDAQGRAVVGRFASDEASARITRVRERACAALFPLWIGVEPV